MVTELTGVCFYGVLLPYDRCCPVVCRLGLWWRMVPIGGWATPASDYGLVYPRTFVLVKQATVLVVAFVVICEGYCCVQVHCGRLEL